MSLGLVWRDERDHLCIDCPLCGSPAGVKLHGSGLRIAWHAQCDHEHVLQALDQTLIISEIAGGHVDGGESRKAQPQKQLPSPLTVRIADLERAQPPRWAWDGRIVRGYLNLLIGNEGVGKGTVVAWLIARLTRGELPGDLCGCEVGVAVLGDEDSFDDVWTPRLHAAGANLDRVVQVERPDGGFVDVRQDRELLADVVREHGIGLLYFDQLLDNLGVGVDDWRQKAVRDALQPPRALARELDIAILGCLHPNKRADSFRSLIAGAPAFNSVSRSSLLLAQHPDDESRRVLVRGKGNLAQTPTAVEFEITSHSFTANGHRFSVPLASAFTEGTLTVEDLVGAGDSIREHSKVGEACEIIEALLPRDGEWHPAKLVKDACLEDGIEDHTVKRAKLRLGLEHRRTETFPAATEWRWPPSEGTLGTSALAVPSVPSVPTANGGNPLRGSSQNTQNSENSQNKRSDCDPSTPSCCCADGGHELDELGRCSRCYGQLTPPNLTAVSGPP